MKIHHHSCKCGWADLNWCQVPDCRASEQLLVCSLCISQPSYQELLTERAILGLKIQSGQLSCQPEYDTLQKIITSRSKTNLHPSHIERMSR